ncbi:ArsR family transcriptional regulator [Umezawaea endophytica]|uniref:ArsR family transcriptional regulator n=1 Tax=Umezawaea endophytica TaxID=1654476 RepID=UPI003559104E
MTCSRPLRSGQGPVALDRGEACVTDLTEDLGVPRPTVSFRLKVLVNVGLVLGDRRGALIWYALP